MPTKIRGLSVLQKLKPDAWLIAEFVLPVFVEPFYRWLRDYVSSRPPEELQDLERKTRIHIQSVDYEAIGRVGVGAYWMRNGVIHKTEDTIAFVFTTYTDDGKYNVSASGDPIVLDYFVRMLTAISRQWPDASAGIAEYIARLKVLAATLHTEAPGRRGRKSQYSQAERDGAVEKWEQNLGAADAKALDIFLVDEFGEKDPDSMQPRPIVSRSTFYSWRKDYHKRHVKKANK